VAQAHSFWMIVDGAVPTAFRARDREDLLPTLRQLQRTQPGVKLVWFENGRSWDSPEAAREAREIRRRDSRSRKPSWRPGGAHVDPREKYKITRDEKRARFKKRATFARQRSEEAGPSSPPDKDRASGDRPFSHDAAKPYRRNSRSGETDERPPRRSWKPSGTAPAGPARMRTKGPWKPKGPWRPKGPRRPRGLKGPKKGS
jgi:hypothetical protein